MQSDYKNQVVYQTNADYLASYEKLKEAQSNVVASLDQTEKGIIWFRLAETKTVFNLFPKGKLQVKWNDLKEKQVLLKIVRSLLVPKQGQKLEITPTSQQAFISYPPPKIFKLYWCDEKTEYVKKTGRFRSESQRKRALKHSKELFLSSEHEQFFPSSKHEQLFDFSDRFLKLDGFVYNQKKYPNQMSHIKTGYFKEIWSPIQKYLVLMKKYGLNKIPGYPKISFIKTLFFDDIEDMMPEKYPKAEEGYVSIARITDLVSKIREPTKDYCAKHGIPWQVPVEIVKEIEEMQELIIGQVYSQILGKIQHGIPVRGLCDLCPNREVIIKREDE